MHALEFDLGGHVVPEQINLRDYQHRAVDAVLNEFQESQSTLLVLPTGCGKTVCFAEIIRRFGKRALVIAHRTELITQAVDKIHRTTGLRCEIEMADLRVMGFPDVVVSTVQTQTSGGDGLGRMGRFSPDDFGLVIIDEAHHAPAKAYRRMLDYYKQNPRLKILGVTATPDRADEKALGQIFDTVAFDYEILDAIHDGWLVPIEQQVVSVAGLDYSSIRTTAGDLNGGDLATVMEEESNLHAIAAPTIDIAGTRRTLVFAASVRQAERLCEIFNRHKNGCADFVCGTTPKELRAKTIKRFEDGAIQYVVNVGVFTEGFDAPHTEIIVLARPTKSRSLYAQMIGRGTRPLPGIVDALPANYMRRHAIKKSDKPACLVVDFAGNAGRHKLVTTADILGGNVDAETIARARQVAEKTGKPIDMVQLLNQEAANIAAEKAAAAARRAALVAKAQYSTSAVSPFNVFDISPGPDRGWNDGKQISEKELGILQKQGIKTDGLKYHEGKALIREIFRRWDAGLCSYKQAAQLKKRGLDPNMTREQASATMTEIAQREGWGKR